MTDIDLNSLGPAERSAYSNGYGECRRKFEERPEFNNWNGKPLGEMSRGALIDAVCFMLGREKELLAMIEQLKGQAND